MNEYQISYFYHMEIDDLNELLEWDGDAFRDEDAEEGEERKPNPTSELCKACMNNGTR